MSIKNHAPTHDTRGKYFLITKRGTVIFGVMALMTMLNTAYAKDPAKASASYLLKINKRYSECMSKTGGITLEMLNCAATATDKLDKYLWPSTKRNSNQFEERKRFITNTDLFCVEASTSFEGTSGAVAYSDCVYQQFIAKIQKK